MQQIPNIDAIFLINLEQRVEKCARSLRELAVFGIEPLLYRAIYGWTLPRSLVERWAFKMKPGMNENYLVHLRTAPTSYPDSAMVVEFDKHIGLPCFHTRTTLGAFGCALSHLSVVELAYHAGYEAIWILEDAFTIVRDPHLLGDLMEALTKEEKGWDLLYTDHSQHYSDSLHSAVRWRPEYPLKYNPPWRRAVGSDFFQLNVRNQLRSYILKRSGMRKMLDFAYNQGFFLPLDLDISLIPDIKLFSVREDVVRGEPIRTHTSDVLYQHF